MKQFHLGELLGLESMKDRTTSLDLFEFFCELFAEKKLVVEQNGKHYNGWGKIYQWKKCRHV